MLLPSCSSDLRLLGAAAGLGRLPQFLGRGVQVRLTTLLPTTKDGVSSLHIELMKIALSWLLVVLRQGLLYPRKTRISYVPKPDLETLAPPASPLSSSGITAGVYHHARL